MTNKREHTAQNGMLPTQPTELSSARRFTEYGPDSAAMAKQLRMGEEEFKHRAQDIVNDHLDLSYFKGGLTREQIGRVQDLMERHPHIAK